MGLFDFFRKKKSSITLDEGNAINQSYIENNPVPENDENALLRQGSSLLTSRDFQGSIQVFQQMVEKFPAKKGLYLSQIGANYYFMGEYQMAIDYYVKGLEAGGDRSMMDDNIWEATEEVYQAEPGPAPVQRYLDLFPNGNSKKKAEKLLQK